MINDIGLVIRTSRLLRGQHQSALADAIGISRQALIAIERGQANPSDGTLNELKISLGVDLQSPEAISAVKLLRGE